jgi:cyclophilin family peptidyl-prolyl cis-trans isomerase/HEAT repeat protein
MAYREGFAPWVIASGGKRWHGQSEAEAFRDRLVELGVPIERVLPELDSLNTRENARYVAELARERGFHQLGVVTCDWHMARALAAFAGRGVTCISLPAICPGDVRAAQGRAERIRMLSDRLLRSLERLGLVIVVLLAITGGIGCQRKSAPQSNPPESAAAPISSVTQSELLASIRRAEYDRREAAISEAMTSSAEVTVRRAAAEALARSSTPRALERLLPLLADDDALVVSFAAFGSSSACPARAKEVTAALSLAAARLFATRRLSAEPALVPALARSLGRCASEEAERALRAWLSLPGVPERAAALGLGELGGRRGSLDEASLVALLDRAARVAEPLDGALYAFERVTPPEGPLRDRLTEVAARALSRTNAEHGFALRALGHVQATEPLARATRSDELSPAERAAAARELASSGAPGQRALEAALADVVPADPAARNALPSDPSFPVVLSVLEGMSTRPGPGRPMLEALRALEVPSSDPARARRAVLLRCAAARLLSLGAPRWEELDACDPDPKRRRSKLATIAVLDGEKLRGDAAKRYRALASDEDPVVREAALLLLGRHREVQDAPELVAQALSARAPGVAATAAQIIAEHPERVARRTANEGSSDAPTKAPDSRVGSALAEALRADHPSASVGVRTRLIDAVAALGLLAPLQDVERACVDPSATVRAHAERALTALGRDRRCSTPGEPARAFEELSHLAARPVRLSFDTDIGELELELDPSTTPLAVTRVLDLARSGFYDGLEIHRVVPGFVVQFGDPGGDGYGGAARPTLPSELGPAEFQAGDVGMAEAGPDTGSSQLFVTLGRFPHLDGQSTRIGRALPGWERLVPGDRIRKVHVQP